MYAMHSRATSISYAVLPYIMSTKFVWHGRYMVMSVLYHCGSLTQQAGSPSLLLDLFFRGSLRSQQLSSLCNRVDNEPLITVSNPTEGSTRSWTGLSHRDPAGGKSHRTLCSNRISCHKREILQSSEPDCRGRTCLKTIS
jgi:hypothetical protein